MSPGPPYPRSSLTSLASRPRKMSFPSTASISTNHHQISALDFPEAARRYRRFSNVSDAVSRKLSTTLGWRTVRAGGGHPGQVLVRAAHPRLAQEKGSLHKEAGPPAFEERGQS